MLELPGDPGPVAVDWSPPTPLSLLDLGGERATRERRGPKLALELVRPEGAVELGRPKPPARDAPAAADLVGAGERSSLTAALDRARVHAELPSHLLVGEVAGHGLEPSGSRHSGTRQIAPGVSPHLKTEYAPTDSLSLHPDNPRRGDLAAIKQSLECHGQYRSIVVDRRTREVLCGNHTLLGARALGWSEIAVTFVDVTPEQARRILLVDNRTNDLATYDTQALVDLLAELTRSRAPDSTTPPSATCSTSSPPSRPQTTSLPPSPRSPRPAPASSSSSATAAWCAPTPATPRATPAS